MAEKEGLGAGYGGCLSGLVRNEEARTRELLPAWLERQRWYATKTRRVESVAIEERIGWRDWELLIARANGERYFVPLAAGAEPLDAAADERFCSSVVEAMREGLELRGASGSLRFSAAGRLEGEDPEKLRLVRLHHQSSNTGAALGAGAGAERLFLKLYRRLRAGVNPELEVGRFLSEVARFPHCVPLAGALEYVAAEGEPATLALLQVYVPNDGDAWSWTLGHLEGFPAGSEKFRDQIGKLGQRTAELHRAFATPGGGPAFDPEPWTPEDTRAWKAQVLREADETLGVVRMEKLLSSKARLLEHIRTCPEPRGPTLKARHHGDYHLGQVLVAGDDFLVIDFEGEPSRPLEERRRKRSPLRDVAGMLRSLDYARRSAGERPGLEAWLARTREAFLAGYADAAAGSGLFAAFDDVRGLLELAELEKALYELRYEANNRPDWLETPLRGLLDKLAA